MEDTIGAWNTNQSSEGAKGYCDKVTLLYDSEPDRFTSWYDSFRSTVSALAEANYCEIPVSVRVRAASPERGTRLYEVDTYGAGCDILLRALPDHLIPKLSRLDFRYAARVESRKLLPLTAFVEEHGKFGRNVNYFNTRERAKTEGRHAGGRGVAIGSHKSDSRLVVYKRSNESGAVELHHTGEGLEQSIELAQSLMTAAGGMSFYDAIMGVMEGKINAFIRKAGFADLQHLLSLVAPDEEDTSPISIDLPTLSELRTQLANMSAPQRRAFAVALGLKANDLT